MNLKIVRHILPSIVLSAVSINYSPAAELSGWLAWQGQTFSEEGLQNQSQTNLSLAGQVEIYHTFVDSPWESTIELFARLDQEDDERSHADIREAHVLGIYDAWEFKFGISKEYWGATEFAHLVDVINQTDIVENIDGEDKLGQTMLKATWYSDWGSLEAFILPGFRERTFPGQDGRFIATGAVVNTDKAAYESSAEEWHSDAALRFNGSFDALDLGIGIFHGTNRDPLIQVDGDGDLIPYYEQMTQVSLDTSIPLAAWLFKLELLQRDSDQDRYIAVSGGFEFTVVGIFESDKDLGLLAEYIGDERGDEATTFLQNDLFLGARIAFNDAFDTAILAGAAFDLDGGGHLLNLEYERRLNDVLRVEVQLRVFNDIAANDALYPLRDDDYLQIELFYHF